MNAYNASNAVPETADKAKLGPSHYLFLFLATGVYLLFELAFNARLLDVVGTTLDKEAVDNIEIYGRIISGLALTLVIWPWVLKSAVKAQRRALSKAHKLKVGLKLTLSAVLCCAASYAVQEGILQWITLSSDAAQRRAAATLVTLTDAVHSEDVRLEGLPLDQVDLSSPEGKTFLAILPALALSTDNLEEKTEKELSQVVRKRAESATGGPARFFNEVYLESETEIKKLYNGYLKFAGPHAEVIGTISGKQEEAYRNYRNGLGRYTPWTLPERSYSKVRDKVRREGVYVPLDWDPRDKETFYKAIDKSIRLSADNRFYLEMENQIGYTVPPLLNLQKFVAYSKTQHDWRVMTGVPDFMELKVDWSFDQFTKEFYEPWMKQAVDRKVAQLLAPTETFASGGKHDELGKDAIRAAYVPLIAFIFSTIGALVHIIKTTKFALMLKLHNRAWIAHTVLALFAAAMIFGWAMPAATTPNAVSQSLLFTKLEEDTQEKAGPAVAAVMRGLIQIQTEFYPISEAIRKNVLFGIRYGVQG